MKEKVSNLFKIILILILCISISKGMIIISYAANYSFSLTSEVQEASVGDDITLTITTNGLTGNVRLTGVGVTLSDSQKWVEREKSTVTFTAHINSFPVSITATPDELTDNEYNIVNDLSPKTIEIKEKTVESEPPSNNNETQEGNTTEGGNNNTTGETGGGEEKNPDTPQEGENTTVPQDPPQQEQPTQQEAPKSSNNHLSSLTISDGVRNLELKQTKTETTGFNRDVENYTVVFPDSYNFDDLTSVSVKATAEDDKASISGTGNIAIEEGDRTILVRCTAENGSVRTYQVKLTKPIVINKSELKLDSLTITTVSEDEDEESETVKLDNEFNSETYEYEAQVKSNVKSVNLKLVTSKVKDKDIKVFVKGEEISRDLDGNLPEKEIELEEGRNTIKITLVSPVDENVKTDYVLTIEREIDVLASSNSINDSLISNEKRPAVIMGVIIGIIVLLGGSLIVLVIINKKKIENSDPIHEDIEELEERNDDDYDEHYLSDDKLEKLNQKYEESVNESNDSDYDDENKETVEDYTKEEEEKEESTVRESAEERLAKLEQEKEQEIKEEEANKLEKEEEFNKDDYLNDIKKRGKHF